MNRIVKQESELNLVIGARKFVSKLGPRKLAAMLTLSSMLAITSCGKQNEVQTVSLENTVSDDYSNVKYRNRALGGRIVDNHNGELYISKDNDLDSVVEVNNKENNTSSSTDNVGKQTSNNKETTTTSSASTTDSTSTPEDNGLVEDNTSIEKNPDLLPGESVTYFPDGSYVVTPSQDYINPPEDNTQPVNDDQNNGEPSQDEEEPPIIEDEEQEEFKGYVVRKLNYSDDEYFYTFIVNNGEYTVELTSIEFADELSRINSNITALAPNDDALSYALSEGWVKVKEYSYEEDGFLDSVYNIEAVCDDMVAAAKKAKEEADMGLHLVP